MFLLAIFIALIRESVARTLHATEVALVGWLIVFQIMGIGSTMTRNLTVTSALRMMLGFLALPAYISYYVWFWFVGIDSVPQGTCDEYSFFWAKVNIRGWYRTVNKAIWTFALVVVFILGVVGAVVLGGGKHLYSRFKVFRLTLQSSCCHGRVVNTACSSSKKSAGEREWRATNSGPALRFAPRTRSE